MADNVHKLHPAVDHQIHQIYGLLSREMETVFHGLDAVQAIAYAGEHSSMDAVQVAQALQFVHDHLYEHVDTVNDCHGRIRESLGMK